MLEKHINPSAKNATYFKRIIHLSTIIVMILFSLSMDFFSPEADYDLPTPFNVSATTDLSNKITVTWEAICGNGLADHFSVYAKKEGSSTYHIIGKVPYYTCATGEAIDFDFVLDGILDFAYRDYDFKVKTCPEDSYYCANDFSPVATGSAIIDPPYISATDGTFSDKIEISFFEFSFNSQSYKVFRSDTPEGPYLYVGDTYGDADVDGTYVDNVSPGSTYYYKGQICTIYGDCSNFRDDYAIGYSSSSGPSGISATDGTEGQYIEVTWEENPNANGYRVYRSETSTPPADLNDYIPPEVYTNSYQDAGADPYTTYYYWVRSYDTGIGGWTDLSGPDTGWRTYKTAHTVRASDGTSTDQIDLTWGNDDDAFINRYIIYRSITAAGEQINVGNSATTNFTDNLALPGHTYYYWVNSCDELNRCSGPTGPDSGYATLESVGNAGSLTASDGTSPNHVQLDWEPVYGADFYKIYRGQNGDSRPANNFATSTSPTYTDATATPGIQYYYWVQACTDETCSSADATDSGYRAIPSPTNVQASDGSETAHIQITWDSTSGADYYEVFSASALTGPKIQISSPTGTSFSDNGPSEGQALYYWIRACSDLTCSDMSSSDLGWRGITPPANLSASEGEYDQVSLTWDTNPSATSYSAFRADSSDGAKSLLTSNLTTTSYTDLTATPGTTYYYWVKAFINSYSSDFSTLDTGWARGGTLPEVTSITRVGPNPTNATSVQFLVTFNESVTGVDSSDFAIDSSGITGAAITNVEGTGTTRTVTLNTGSASGDLSIDVVDDNSIVDDITNPLGGPTVGDGDFNSGEAYLIDKESPHITAFTRYNPLSENTNADTLVFQVSFNEASSNVSADDFEVNSNSTATITNVQQETGDVYQITVSGGDLADFNGSVSLDISSTQDITDLSGNTLSQLEPTTDEAYLVDNLGPKITSIVRMVPNSEFTNQDMVTIQVNFDVPISNLGLDDFEVVGGSTAIITDSQIPSSREYISLDISSGDLDNYNGQVSVALSPSNDLTDEVGNPILTEDPEIYEYFIIDNTAPKTVTIAGVAPKGVKVFVTKPTELEIEFGEDVKHDGSLSAANYEGNYILFTAGPNGIYDITSCAMASSQSSSAPIDDIIFPIGPIIYDNNDGNGPFIATLKINNGNPLPGGNYRLMVCGTTSIEDLAGNELYQGESDPYVNLNVVIPDTLPETGFKPGVMTGAQADITESQYDLSTGIQMDIPKLGISRPVIGIPSAANGWNLSWLGNDLGYLAGTAYPTWPGNTVITGHSYNNFGLPGPLYNLETLRWGDQIVIAADDQEFVYEVRSVSKYTSPEDISSLQKHETYDWVTLITCNSYDHNLDTFLFRTVVRAVLVEIR